MSNDPRNVVIIKKQPLQVWTVFVRCDDDGVEKRFAVSVVGRLITNVQLVARYVVAELAGVAFMYARVERVSSKPLSPSDPFYQDGPWCRPVVVTMLDGDERTDLPP